jgi:LPS sulfotransferase NodH
MTITPTPEQEHILAEAIQTGLVASAEDALNVGLETLKARLAIRRRSETADEWVARFRAFVHSHPTDTPLLSDEAISRDSIL